MKTIWNKMSTILNTTFSICTQKRFYFDNDSSTGSSVYFCAKLIESSNLVSFNKIL